MCWRAFKKTYFADNIKQLNYETVNDIFYYCFNLSILQSS